MFENWNPKPVITAMYLNPLVVTLKPGETGTVSVITEPETSNISGENLTWESDDETIATVSSDGVITGVGIGTTKIRANVLEFSNFCFVIVKGDMSLNEIAITIPRGQIKQLTLEGEDLENKEVTWSSSDESVATVDSNGVVTGLREGKLTITATVEDNSASCELTVSGLLGDVDNDDIISAFVAYKALVASVDYLIGTEIEKQIILTSDVNKNGVPEANDAYDILKYSVGLIENF